MLNLIKAGAILPSMAYAISSVLLSLLGVFIGMHGAKALFPPN
jgi:fluoride ion exporter CrcB/FEX